MHRFFFLIIVLMIASCRTEPTVDQESTPKPYVRIEGKTMGTYYLLTYSDQKKRDFKEAVDQLLVEINGELSTYESNSLITQFNQADAPLKLAANSHFAKNMQVAAELFKNTQGAFDPTVMPLVNYWGFGTTAKKAVTQIDSQQVASMMQVVGFDKLNIQDKGADGMVIEKKTIGLQLDLSAIAKGYAVDAIGKLLEAEGINDYLIDIGGEFVARGHNDRGVHWQLAIRTPLAGASRRDVQKLLRLENKGMATSGNYENYYETPGLKYGHTINPKTGYPEINKLLSATVIAEDCMTADAYATAFMVMGLEAAYNMAMKTKDIEACLIYGNENEGMSVMLTEGMEKYIQE